MYRFFIMRVMLGLGGNLGDVPGVFLRTRAKLAEVFDVLATSRLYRSAPVGPRQPQFWNMAIQIVVDCQLRQVLDHCRRLEEQAGRDRNAEIRWGPRPLDVDLLMAEHVVHRGPDLVVPHPRLHERAFALVPAADVAPDWVHPELGRSLAELAEQVVARDPGAVELVGPLGGERD